MRSADFVSEGVIAATRPIGVPDMMQTDENQEARAYRVGQDSAGRWLAMEIQGRSGGMFASREAAMRFAGAETAWRQGAVSEPGRPMAFA